MVGGGGSQLRGEGDVASWLVVLLGTSARNNARFLAKFRDVQDKKLGRFVFRVPHPVEPVLELGDEPRILSCVSYVLPSTVAACGRFPGAEDNPLGIR